MSAALLLLAAMAGHGDHAAPTVHAGHDGLTYWMVRGELDAGRTGNEEDFFSWDAEAWIGGDSSKLWLKSEGESVAGDLHNAEVQALYSVPVSDFWDLQAGMRYDFEPDGRAYLAIGLEGLAPYFFETEATAFLSEDGDLSLRLKQEFDLLLTQRLVLTPSAELKASASDVPELGLGAGFTEAKLELTLRYEITRKFAPYVALEYERALGETASIARAAGESVETTSLRAGLRFWF
ncbi:hypothetical protein sos41_35610 [Alphaproteobacteria bacterium SO-S41]|nr:hypothetical protein sos41_35610 [Alphaproteobacteria bacterium SO-S41]